MWGRIGTYDMEIVGNHPVGVRVLETLGMRTDRCAGFTLEFKPNEVVVVRAEYHTDEGEIEQMIRVLDGWRK